MIKNQGYKYIMLILTLIPYTNDFYEKKNGFLLGIFFGLIFIIIDCVIYKKRKENLFTILIDAFIIILFLYGYCT